jgi:hypothetical protein
MPGRSPTLKRASYALARQLEALSLVGQGLPVIEIARRMDLSVARVRIHLHHALKAGLTLYPSALNADEVNNLRQLQAEVLATSRQKALEAQAVISGRLVPAERKTRTGWPLRACVRPLRVASIWKRICLGQRFRSGFRRKVCGCR